MNILVTGIDDLADCMVNCLNAKSGVYNVGTDKWYTLNQLSSLIGLVTGSKIKPKYIDERHEYNK